MLGNLKLKLRIELKRWPRRRELVKFLGWWNSKNDILKAASKNDDTLICYKIYVQKLIQSNSSYLFFFDFASFVPNLSISFPI